MEKTLIFSQFNGGISEDKRVRVANKFSITKNFDVFTYPHKLVPRPLTAALTGENKTYDIVKFLYAPFTGGGAPASGYVLYGLGLTGANRAVWRLDITTNTDGDWAGPSNSGIVAVAGGEEEKVLFHYKNYVYFWVTDALFRIDTTSGSPAQYQAMTGWVNIAPPVRHPSDDIAYFFHDNIVSSLNDTSWTAAALTLPSNLKIVAACPHGPYLAVACVTKDTLKPESVVFSWDRDSSLANVTSRADFDGEVKKIASLEGRLIAVTYVKNFITKDKVQIQQIIDENAIPLNEITTDVADGITFYDTDFIKNNILYFPLKATLASDTRLGIWAVNSSGAATLDFLNSDVTTSSYEGIYHTGDYLFIAHSNDGSTDVSSPTGAYSPLGNCLYESLIIGDLEDLGKSKKLLAIGVMTEPLPASAQVSVEHRVDAETSYTSTFYHNTADSLYKEAINTYAGANLPEFKELQIRLYSQSGAVITAYMVKYEVLGKEVI